MKKPIILLGSGGHARVLLSVLRRREVEILGITDPSRTAGETWLGCKVLGQDGAIHGYDPNVVRLVNGIGSLPGDGGLRSRLFEAFTQQGYTFQNVIDPTALIADDVSLGEGVQIMAGSIIQPGARIGENTIINTGSIIEHDCHVGCHVHIAPGVACSGGIEIGDHVHLGTGAIVIQGITIGAHTVVGAGGIVTQAIGERQIVYPARSRIQDL